MTNTELQSARPSSSSALLAALCCGVLTTTACGGELHGDHDGGPLARRDIVLLIGEQPVVECEPLGDVCVLEGDIALDPSQYADVDASATGGNTTKESALLSSSGTWWKWPDGVVPYTIESGLPQGIRDKVAQAIEHWHTRTPIRFVPRSDQPDYVTFRYSTAGYAYANIGRRGGQQFISLVNNPVGVIAHEMGHTLGFFHEHTRPDRDEHVTVHFYNVRPGFEGNFYKYSSGRAIGAYDASSIMHYPSYEFSKNGYATITRKDGTAYPGNYTAVSARDIEAVVEIYGDGASSATSTGEIVVDSNNANNDVTRGYVEVSDNWVSSNWVPGYHGTGYWYAPRASVSDAASFYFYLPEAATKTIDAYWTAGGNRAPDAPFVMTAPDGSWVDKVFVDQRSNGGQWNTLGTWAFPKGWNRVQLSRWTSSRDTYVIADAVRVR